MAHSICVFCASSDHVEDAYMACARDLGAGMAERGHTLVYGGGNNGLMGQLSTVMAAMSGSMVGVIPRRLRDLGYAFDAADEMIVTDGMRERKAVMEERADGFIGLPGGFGTLEELLEIITLRQLRMLDKPIVILNVRGFFDNLLAQFETAYSERFVDPSNRSLYHVTSSVHGAIDHIEAFHRGE